ncbi:MAG: hypothetical protein EBZ36_13670, partial [Acidobacteria bacterium]|nr:hypothetical protein [Acidobacteriota bacterium]
MAQIQDAQGNLVTTSTAAVTATVVSPTTGSLGGTTTVNAVAGVAAFSGLTISGLDGTPLTLRFSSLGLISADAAAPVFVSGVGAASRLGIRTQPVAGISGAALAPQPVVEVRDSGGNVVTGSTASVTVAIQGTGGSLTTGPTTVSAAAGIATFANLVLNGTVGVPYTLQFSSTGLTPVASSTLFVTGVGLPTQLVILTQPVAGASGSLLTTQPVVAIRDAGNNTVTTASATVSVAIALGSGGSIGGAQTVTTAGGVATFSNISFTGSTATDYALQFAASGLASANSNIIRLTGSGAASQLDITTQPVAGLSGATLTTQPVVVVRDAGGNRVMSSTAPITISVSSGTGGALSGTQTINAISGEATFSNLSLIGKQGTNYVLGFSSPGLTPVNSVTVTVTGAGVATQLAITTQPVGGASGAALATQPIVEVRDSGGNKVSSTASVTVTIQSGANGTLGGTQTVAAVAGVATFTTLTLAGRVNTNYVLQFSSPGLLSAISNSVVVTSGAATQLAIITQPVGGVSGTALTVQPVVEVRDALGNRVTGSTVSVTASIFSGAGGVLSGTTVLNAVDGRVNFTDLVLTGLAGTDYILQFASSTLVFPTSNPVVLSAGAASQIMVTTQPVGGPSGALLAVQPRVEIRDAQGNRVTNSSVAVSVSISSGVGGTLGGTTTV